MAALYAVYHGPEGLKTIARRVNGLASLLAAGAAKLGHGVPSAPFFDTVTVNLKNGDADKVVSLALYEKASGAARGGRDGVGAGGLRCWMGRWSGGVRAVTKDTLQTAGAYHAPAHGGNKL
jgi:hypothetical protein